MFAVELDESQGIDSCSMTSDFLRGNYNVKR